MLQYAVEHFFAGLWTMVWHFGIAIGLAILLGAAAYFIPAPFTKLKILCAVLAVLCVTLVVGEGIGVHMGAQKCAAQEKALGNFVTRTVKSTQTKKARGAADPWDSPNN